MSDKARKEALLCFFLHFITFCCILFVRDKSYGCRWEQVGPHCLYQCILYLSVPDVLNGRRLLSECSQPSSSFRPSLLPSLLVSNTVKMTNLQRLVGGFPINPQRFLFEFFCWNRLFVETSKSEINQYSKETESEWVDQCGEGAETRRRGDEDDGETDDTAGTCGCCV